MKTPTEITKKAESMFVKMESEDELLIAINGILKDVKSGKYSDEDEVVLSKIAYKLSVLMFGLGRYVARYTILSNSAYIYRKFSYATEFKRLKQEGGRLAKEIESDSELGIVDKYENQIKAQYFADVMKTLYDECDRFVMVLLSRAKNVSREKINSTLQT